MIPVAGNHLLQLVEAILQNLGCRFVLHALERIGTPCWHFRLDENPLPVAVLQNTPVLRPMNAGKNAVQVLHIVVVVRDPRGRFRHAIARVAAGHSLHTH